MAFCMYCGKEVEEGKICTCQENTPVNTAETGMPVNGNMMNGAGMPANGNMMNGTGMPVNGNMMNGTGMPANGNMMNGTGMPANGNMLNGAGMPVNGNMINGTGMPVNGNMMNGMGNGMNMQGVYNNAQFNEMQQKSKMYIAELWGAWVSLIKAPVTAGVQFINSASKNIAFGLIILQAILTGIFGIQLCNEFNDAIGYDDYKINLVMAFLLSVVGSLLVSAVVFGLIFIVVRILKGNATWENNLCIASLKAVISVPFQLIGIILCLAGSEWSVYFFAFGSFAGLLVMMAAVSAMDNIKKDYCAYLFFIFSLVCLFAWGIICNVGMPMYLPSELREGFEGVKEFMNYFS